MSLGTWGESQLQNAVTGFFGNPYLRDYTHAAKTFLPNSYELAPKLKFLFHTVFEVNPNIVNLDDANVNLSVLVKTVKLPSFNIETQTLNQYNRKRLNQTKIKYDPIDITFHDDSGNIISSLWYRYYTYYFKDGQNPQVVFNGKRGAAPNVQNAGGGVNAGATDTIYTDRTQYQSTITGYSDWGYTGQGVPNSKPGVKEPFFKNITVFGINRHNFISYTLINPIITRFGHDTYAYEQNNGVMENTMTIDYETVVYNQGAIEGGEKSGDIIKGFGDKTVYDKRVSPIAIPGANQTILGQGGLVDAAGGFIKDLGNGPAGWLNAARTAGVTYNTFKNANLTNIIQGELTKGLTQVLQGTSNPTRNSDWEIPVYGQTGSISGTAGNQYPAKSAPQTLGDYLQSAVNNYAGSTNPNSSTGSTAIE